MHLKTWIAALFVLFLGFGIATLWMKMQPPRDNDSDRVASVRDGDAGEGAHESEDRDAPEFTSHNPERFLRTHWTALDDNGANHRCNQDNSSQMQNETPCAASPVDPEVIVVGANDYRTGDVQAGYYRTSDGGNSWQEALLTNGPPASACEFSGDPSITCDATGKFYAIYCAYFCQHAQGVYCQTSVDNGLTWSSAVPVGVRETTGFEVDKPMSACDISPGSPYVNNCYAAWMEVGDNNSIFYSRSVNGGASFFTPVRISTNSDCWCPAVTVGPNGEVYVTWIEHGSHTVKFDRSLDGGVTWGNDITVAAHNAQYLESSTCGGFRINHYPNIGCDISNGPHRGSIYICFDQTRGTDVNVFFSRSINGGLNWSDTVRVNDDATNRQQFWPWLAVHPRTGDIGISWVDRRGDPNNCTFRMYATISTDGGSTFALNFPISDQVVNPTNSNFLGDYTGSTFTSVGFVSSWADPRNDVSDAYATWWNNGNGLAVQSPNGGELWALQQPCTTRWQFRYAPDTLFVELNRNYPTGTWERLATVSSASGSYVWLSSGLASNSSRVRVIGQHYATIGDTSNANFAIGLAPPQNVTAQRDNDAIVIRWSGNGSPYYRVYSAPAPTDSFTTYVGSTSDSILWDWDAFSQRAKFYIVRASTAP